MFGMHLWPSAATGTLNSRPGAIMAASMLFEVTVTGKGGHAAMPHLTKDPVVAAAHAITALQASHRSACARERLQGQGLTALQQAALSCIACVSIYD